MRSHTDDTATVNTARYAGILTIGCILALIAIRLLLEKKG